ncbi:MAG: Lrp/AsnC family transcriptional regulator [Thermoleophilia bacterium]|nr:Lrp/AsnC family transcriptional regulator [Thermoleophilia bacterium]
MFFHTTARLLMELDTLDHQILTLLTQDGRVPNVHIGAALGVSQSTIKKRIDRLIDGGACRVLAIVDPGVLGFRTSVVLLIRSRPGSSGGVVGSLKALPEICWAAQTIGPHGVFAEAILRGSDEIFDLVARRIAGTPGVDGVETLVVTRQISWRPIERRVSTASRASGRADRYEAPAWRGDAGAYPGAAGAGDGTRPSERIDDADVRIIALLQEDGRRPAAEIARMVRLSQPTVKSRIDRLVGRGVCKIAAVVDPAVLGLLTGAFVQIRVDSGSIVETGDALARMPAITWLCHTTGRFDLLAEIHMADTREVLEFAGRTIAEIPGVRTAEVSLFAEQRGGHPFAWCPQRS